MAASFILFGSLMRPVGYIITSEKKRWTDVIIIVVACFGVWLSKTQNSALVLMYKNQYGDYFWFFLGALCGIIAVLYVGKYLYLLVKNPTNYIYKMTMWVGFNSLVLFPVHIIVKEFVSPAYRHFLPVSPMLIILFVTLLYVSIPLCNFITKYLPWMLGIMRGIRSE